MKFNENPLTLTQVIFRKRKKVMHCTIILISGGGCCRERIKGFTIHGEPDHLQIYGDDRGLNQYMEASINVSLPESYKNTRFSNITIAIPAKANETSILTLCEVEVYLGKCIMCREKSPEDIRHIINESL